MTEPIQTEPIQYAIDFSGKLPPSAQIGMKAADDHADHRWKRWVDGVIQQVARTHQEFTVDEVIAGLEALPDPPNTHALAAMGPRMKEVSKVLRYMDPTDRVQRSKREASRGNFLRVWKSLLWDGRK
jgi:hypothetical protein